MPDQPRILIVDDDSQWIKLLTDLLESADYVVEKALSVEGAHDKLLGESYEAIIVDLLLGSEAESHRFGGFELLKGIRWLRSVPGRQGPAIVVSAYGTPRIVRWIFKKFGAFDFFDKQKFDEERFLYVVGEAVREFESKRHELTPEERAEYKRVTRQFLRGEPVRFHVPDDAEVSWKEES